ncbi:integron integrase intI [Candidatus Magnetomorum sp. HK-1]|nr:integron integrase intI [Candidatus Magnetomorum sp. HK-1]
MKSRDELKEGELKIEQFLTHLTVHKNVAPLTQNQAMNALVFLYKKVLKQPLDQKIDAVYTLANSVTQNTPKKIIILL